jgi:elongation factor G
MNQRGGLAMNVATSPNNGSRVSGPRLIAIVGPYQSGKTTLLEALLFRSGATTRQGKAGDKSLAGDATPESRSHGMGVEHGWYHLHGRQFHFH